MKEVKEDNPVQQRPVEQEIGSLKQEISEMRFMLNSVLDAIIAQNNNTNPTVNAENPTLEAQNAPSNTLFSIGNEGVPTDRQTDTSSTGIKQADSSPDLASLMSNIKTDLKVKFRKLTKQEFKVFSAIYILEEQGEVDYRMLADKLALSESSIRDYIMKIERKGIPIAKKKVNNKRVLLHIGEELREIAPLQSLMHIREPAFN